VDEEIIDSLTYHLNQQRAIMRLGEEVKAIEPITDDQANRVKVHLASGKQIVTVSPGRKCSSTLSAASRVTVPSANSSPEQATIPTFFCGRSGMMVSLIFRCQVINNGSDLFGERMGKLPPALIKFSNALRFELPVAAVHVQHGRNPDDGSPLSLTILVAHDSYSRQ
jgi:hypothetical protein